MAPFVLTLQKYNPLAGIPGPTPSMTRAFAAQQHLMDSPALELTLISAAIGLLAGGYALLRAIRFIDKKPHAAHHFLRAVLALVAAEGMSSAVTAWLQARNTRMLGAFSEDI